MVNEDTPQSTLERSKSKKNNYQNNGKLFETINICFCLKIKINNILMMRFTTKKIIIKENKTFIKNLINW